MEFNLNLGRDRGRRRDNWSREQRNPVTTGIQNSIAMVVMMIIVVIFLFVLPIALASAKSRSEQFGSSVSQVPRSFIPVQFV